ncbi:MAG TPA: hypothetical protein VMX35_00020, partial [Acidobacteriota bacterium]|nr:hypothetical protein [Acidobacteriota bacterium]
MVKMWDGMSDAQKDLLYKSALMYGKPGIANKADAFAKGIMGLTPFFGPAVTHAADQWDSGDKWGSIGTLLGLTDQVAMGAREGKAGVPSIEGARTTLETNTASVAAKISAEEAVEKAELARRQAEATRTGKPLDEISVGETFQLKGGPKARLANWSREALQTLFGGSSRDVVGVTAKKYQDDLAAFRTDMDAARKEIAVENAKTRDLYEAGKQVDAEQHAAKVQKLVEEYNEKIREANRVAAETNQKNYEKYQADAKEISDENARAEELLNRRREVESQLEAKRNELVRRQEAAGTKAKADEKGAWGNVTEKIESGEGSKEGNGQELLSAIEEAEKKRLKGTTPEAIRTFRSIIRQVGGEKEPVPGSVEGVAAEATGTAAPTSEASIARWEAFKKGMEALSGGGEAALPAGVEPGAFTGKEEIPLTFDQIHGFVTELGHEIAKYDPRAPQDVRAAMIEVRSKAVKMMNEIAEANGAMDDLRAAREATQRYQKAFGVERPERVTAATKVERSLDPEGYKERQVAARVSRVAAIDPEVAKIASDIDSLNKTLDDLPRENELRNRVKSPPDLPEPASAKQVEPLEIEPYRPPPPPKPKEFVEGVSPKTPDIADIRGEKLRTGVEKFRKTPFWYVVEGAALPIAALTGHGSYILYMLGGIPLKNFILDRLSRNDFISWLNKPTIDDLEAISYLKPETKELFKDQIDQFVNAERKVGGKPVHVNNLLQRTLESGTKVRGALAPAAREIGVGGAARGQTIDLKRDWKKMEEGDPETQRKIDDLIRQIDQIVNQPGSGAGEETRIVATTPTLPMHHPLAQSPALDPRLADVAKQFPRLVPYLSQVQIQQGKKTDPNDDRELEFYP